MAFLDPNTPLATCTSKGCNNCTAGKRVHCHFRPKELFHFYTIVFPSFLVGGAAILHISGWWLGVWLALIVGYFGFLEIRVMCSHCPHYAEEGNTLQCCLDPNLAGAGIQEKAVCLFRFRGCRPDDSHAAGRIPVRYYVL